MARTDRKWQTGGNGTYIQTIAPAGYDILINGSNKYLNFNTTVGSSGYGIRDNAGTMEFKNNSGAWTPFGGGGAGSGFMYFVEEKPDAGTYATIVGDIDGVNDTFTTSQGLYLTGSLIVWLNGQKIAQGTAANMFSEVVAASGTFQFVTPPPLGAVISIQYMTVSSTGGIQSIVAGTNVQVDNTDPYNPIISVIGAGTGTVTSVSVVTANGVSGSVATSTTTPAITLTLGAITPTSVNGLTIDTTTGTFDLSNGKTFTVTNTLTLAGTDGSTLNIGAGGTLGSAAFTAASAYEVPLTFSTGLTRTVNTITVNTSQNIATLSNLTSNGFVKTSGGTGALSVDTTSYQTLDAALTSISGISWIQGDLPYWSGTDVSARLAKDTNATRYLSNQGTSNNPSWNQVNLANGVTGDLPYANITQGSALSVLGVTGNATADLASIVAANDGEVLRRSGTAVAFGTVATAGIANNAITYAKLQEASAHTMLANNTSGATELAEVDFNSPASVITLSASIAFTAGAAPTTVIGNTYSWRRVGDFCDFVINLSYTNDGTTLTQILIDLPSDMPTPAIPTGYTGADAYIYPIESKAMQNATGTGLANSGGSFIKRNAADNGFEIRLQYASGTYSHFVASGQYPVA